MAGTPGGRGGGSAGITLIVASVVGILLLFLLVQAVGTPIPAFGGELGLAYSVLVYVPVVIVCALALRKARKMPSGKD